MSPSSKTRLAALAALLPASLLLAPLSAHALDMSFSGGANGVDPLGGTYVAGPNLAGFATWGEAPFTNGGADPTFNAAGLSNGKGDFATSFIFTYTSTQALTINTAFDTGFTQIGHPEGQGWDTTFLSPTSVEFTAPSAGEFAPAGHQIDPGDQFNVIVGFDQRIDPSQFKFTVTWGDGGVPEPQTWAVMLGGFGLVGAALRRRRATLAAA